MSEGKYRPFGNRYRTSPLLGEGGERQSNLGKAHIIKGSVSAKVGKEAGV